ncbi:unnamed protein product [Adineta ricciae]|uniref:TLDc domain-containing protein n=1 Tax=Adineta ricciae TaxID=249248 RepID=A0A815Q0B2_ADIRI|nr:unnamed protein product [Adineta ricciae]
MDYDQQLFINQLSSIKYTEEKLDELNLPSKSSTGTINDENDLDLKTNIVQCLNEEVQSVRPFIQSKSDDQIVPKRSLFHLIIHGSKQFSSYKYQFYPSEGSLLNVIQWQKLISWSGKKDWKLFPNYGPTFGHGADLFVCSESNLIGESYSKFSSSYRDPTGLGWKSLTGKQQFLIDDIEIYH